MRDPSGDFDIVLQKPGELLFVAHRNVNIVIWYSGATLAGVRAMDEVIPSRAEACPEGMSTIHVATESGGMPTPEARDAFVRQGERWGHTIACVSIVIEKTGFGGSALRSAITGILMLVRGSFPTRVHGSVREAAEWVPSIHVEKTGVSIDPRGLREVLERARAFRVPEDGLESRARVSA